jgi:hypothetical protein
MAQQIGLVGEREAFNELNKQPEWLKHRLAEERAYRRHS